ncbi:hypothetical protein REA38_11690 [Serratia sp. MF2]|uniref:hypothetical protein n=1 Tax=Serratia sp. MF1(2023) TaxID=3059171 RepID=UPI0027F98DB8|nr:hypothetical protein [Serratia sp. MF1(2023)]MDQ7104212.1 hypothetical protein [Serratia sp. MF1(2023)]
MMNLVWQLKGKLDGSLPGAANKAAASISGIGKAAKNVNKNISGITKPLGKLTALLTGGAFAGGIAGFWALAKSSAAAQNSIDKASKRLGISAQAFGNLSYAAKSAGISQENFESLTGKLNKTIGSAVQGTKSAQLAFERAGVSIKNSSGKLKSTDQILIELSDRFKKMPEGIYKADLAMALFGQAGADMVPLLEKGSSGINDIIKEGERLGIVFSETDRKAAKELSAGLSKLKKAGEGVSASISRQLIPVLSPLISRFGDWINSNRELINIKISEAINKISNSINDLIVYLPVLINHISNAWGYIDGVAQSIGGWDSAIKYLGYSIAGIKILQFTAGVWAFSKSIYGVGKALAIASSAVFKFTAALLANPIGIIVAGIAALVAAGYFLYKNWDSVTKGISSTWEWLSDSISNAWNKTIKVLMSTWENVKNYFSEAIYSIVSNFDDGFINGLIKLFSKFDPLGWVSTKINEMIKYLTGIDLADSGKKMISSFGNGLLNHWNRIKSDIVESVTGWLPDWVTGKSSDNIDLPNLPAYANGGLITHPQTAIIGEDGPEMVIPLTKPARGRELLQEAAGALGTSISNNGDEGSNVYNSSNITNVTREINSSKVSNINNAVKNINYDQSSNANNVIKNIANNKNSSTNNNIKNITSSQITNMSNGGLNINDDFKKLVSSSDGNSEVNITMPAFSPNVNINVTSENNGKSISDQVSDAVRNEMNNFSRLMDEWIYQQKRKGVF